MYKISTKFIKETVIRLTLLFIYLYLKLFVEAFERKILPEELWYYQYPRTKSFIPNQYLWLLIIFLPLSVIYINYKIKKDEVDFQEAILCCTLSTILTSLLTRFFKLITGRPRPDFFWRCFPNGYANKKMLCSGNKHYVNEGRQSFPSGHSSIAFASFGFVTLYFISKLHVFDSKGYANSWRLLVAFLPLFLACICAISRSCDYHHHPTDILAGSLLGSVITTICYHHYYPPFYKLNSDKPYAGQTENQEQQ